MQSAKSPLQNLQVANPCPASWRDMKGDDRTRYCGECKLNVYNLSGMTAAEAEELLLKREGRLCVHYYQRADGKMMTTDRPKGVVAARMKFARAILLTAGMLVTGFGYAIQREMSNSPEPTWVDKTIEAGRTVPGLQPLVDMICPPEQGRMIVGSVAPPTPPGKP